MASLLEKEICPSPEDLEYRGPVQCPVEGCEKELPSSACLRMHVLRRHHGKQLEKVPESSSREGPVAFYCPAIGCNRSKEGGEPFPRLGQLKQHYQAMHGEKNHVCSQCGKRFALRDGCSRHEQECQQKIVCLTCGLNFRSRNALYQHAKRKGHTLPGKTGKKMNLNSRGTSNITNVVFVPVPTSIKLVLPVPKRTKVLVSNFTQTEEEEKKEEEEESPTVLLCEKLSELQSSSSQTTLSLLPSSSFFSHTHLLRSPSELLSLGTQTTSPPPPPLVMAASPVVSTQTDAAELCDFGTQTAGSRHSSSLSTCTIPPCTEEAPIQTHASTIGYIGSSTPLDLVEFGTQTLSSSTEVFRIGESDTVDFGTQTIRIPSDLDDSFFSRNLLPPQCLDFGTQTLDYPFNPSSSSSESIPPVCPHSFHSDTRDQGSQTLLNQ